MRRHSYGLVTVVALVAINTQLPATASSEDLPSLAVGGFHSCYVTMLGGVQCWGNNAFGELGDGTTSDSPVPVYVSGFVSGVQAAATPGYVGDFTCLLTAGSGVKCWGDNTYGELGDGTGLNSLVPVDVAGLSSGVSAITAGGGGGGHACALTDTGSVSCWGYNASGQLGDGSTANRLSPVPVSGLADATAVSAGGTHTCAMTSTGGLKCWGRNVWGTLGNGTTVDSTTPVDVSGLTSDVVAVAGGSDHTCALTSGGGVKCWGYNGAGQLGNNTTTQNSVPVDVSGLASGVQAISAGLLHSCALLTDGTAKCWGWNFHGQLGDGTTVTRLTPVTVSGLADGVAIGAGAVHTCALREANGVACWGRNDFGQLGDGTTVEQHTPVEVIGLDFSEPSDNDGDGFANDSDNCPDAFNPDQADAEGDGVGDTCDPDDDNDGLADDVDACPTEAAATANGCPASIENISEVVLTLNLGVGNQQSLLASLQAAQAAATEGNVNAAQGQIGAFVNKVRALRRSGRLSALVADALIAEAQLL